MWLKLDASPVNEHPCEKFLMCRISRRSYLVIDSRFISNISCTLKGREDALVRAGGSAWNISTQQERDPVEWSEEGRKCIRGITEPLCVLPYLSLALHSSKSTALTLRTWHNKTVALKSSLSVSCSSCCSSRWPQISVHKNFHLCSLKNIRFRCSTLSHTKVLIY